MTHFLSSPYARLMRLHQPVGILLLFWPCAWSLALASGGMPMPELLLIFLAGAILMRAVGCIVNDMTDKKLDQQVERTRSRPLASGEMREVQALTLLALLLTVSLAIALTLPPMVLKLALAVLPLIVLYPWMKRITWWPQLFLGITFNWGALMGWGAVRGTLDWPALLLYVACVFWTLGYDTIYAHQDKEDDMRAGIKSTALRFGAQTKKWLMLFYGFMLVLLVLLGTGMGLGLYYFAFTAIFGVSLLAQLIHVRLDTPQSCAAAFSANAWCGAIYFCACLAGEVSLTPS